MKLAWIDLETTGTDESCDPIIEFAMVITEGHAPFEQLDATASIVEPPESGWSMGPAVVKMHATNGLLRDCFGSKARSLAEVESTSIEVLAEHGKPHDFVLAGSGVGHFDRRFIAAQMPKLDRWFRYYAMDVGVLRRALWSFGMEDVVSVRVAGEKTHRALEDINDHIDEMRHYATVLQRDAARA